MFRIDLDLVTFYVIIFEAHSIASSYLGVGLIAASFTILFKRGNPIIVLFMAGTALISGAFYSNSHSCFVIYIRDYSRNFFSRIN